MIPKALLGSLAIAIAVAGCSSAPAAAPTAPPAQQAAAAPTQAAPAPTQAAAPTVAPTKAPAAPTAAPTTAPTAAPTAAPKTAALPNFNEYSFEATTTTAGQTIQSSMAAKSGKLRMEASMAGQQSVMLVDQNAKVAYMWTAGQKQAMKIPMDQALQQTAGADLQVLTDQTKTKLTGTEMVEGQLCDVYETPSSLGTTKTWVSKSSNFPVKSEITTPQGTITTIYKNFKTGGLAGSLFELPADMQVVDLGNLVKPGAGGQMPNIPGLPTKP